MMNENITQALEIKDLALSDISALYAGFNSSSQGLALEQALKNYQIYGSNRFSLEKEIWPPIQFVKLFFSPLSLLLIGLSLLSYLTGEHRGAALIGLMVFLSATLTFLQEYKSNKAAKKLQSLVSTKVSVVRSDRQCEIDLAEVVPGDLVRLSVGDLIPADVRIVSSKDLFINQASLTGESLPAEKSHLASNSGVTSSFDWPNLAFMGSHVVSGMGEALVLKTGNTSFFGQVAQQTTAQSKHSGFDEGISRFTWLMLRLMAAMIPAVFFINGMMKGDWLEAALFAIAVGVGLAPEMLPMLVTINLAKGAIVLSKRQVIIKRLNAMQSLGAMNILCTDKTGTLTQDEIILERHVDIYGVEDERVLEYAYLNSRYQAGLKNLLDVAILKHADVHQKLHEGNVYRKIDEIPFDFQRRRMSVVVRKSDDRDILICKGAVEEIISCCKYAQIGDALIKLAGEHQLKLQSVVDDLNNDGFRVIAVAIREEAVSDKSYSVADESSLILLGYIAFLDPPKDSAKPAIQALRACGIEVKILTGDNELITRKVCRDVGLPVDQVMLGSQIDELDDVQLADRVGITGIFAKMTPQQKARVIRILQSQGGVVGYLGDGINDGPGLKTADVSISVDSAVDIAKESADIILLEKSLMVLFQGVLEGRRVFGNIMKYIKMSASSNFGNMFSMLGASALLPFLPMAPVQILLNNLLYDFSQTAVPTDAVDSEYLKSPRAWDIRGLSRYIFCIGPISSIFDYLTFALMWFILKFNTLELSPLFQTGWFVESLLSQTLVVYVIRTGKIPFKESAPSIPLVVTTLVICTIGIALPFTAIGAGFEMGALPQEYWYGLALILPCYLLMTQLMKMWFIKKWGLI